MEWPDRLGNEDETDGGVNGFTLFVSASISCCTIAPPVASWQFGANKKGAVDGSVVGGARARLVWSQSLVPKRGNGLMEAPLEHDRTGKSPRSVKRSFQSAQGLLGSFSTRLWPLNTVFCRGQKVLGSRPVSLGVTRSHGRLLLCQTNIDGFTSLKLPCTSPSSQMWF